MTVLKNLRLVLGRGRRNNDSSALVAFAARAIGQHVNGSGVGIATGIELDPGHHHWHRAVVENAMDFARDLAEGGPCSVDVETRPAPFIFGESAADDRDQGCSRMEVPWNELV
jgi:hypothetical protein